MNILYVARHTCGLNDDEGAIRYGLEKLGHTVIVCDESNGPGAHTIDADFCLFHSWSKLSDIAAVKIPKVFWYFDLVDYSIDIKLGHRNTQRANWIKQVTSVSDLGFCTDGDWVKQDRTGKLRHLMQGADERVVGMWKEQLPPVKDLLFTGTRTGGKGRQNFVDFMRNTYPNSFHHVEKGVYQEKLSKLIKQSKIVLAPDHPVTNLYWSNRVYTTLGFGGFLLHPYCRLLTHHYTHGQEIVFYKSMEELQELISHYLDHPEERLRIQEAALERTKNNHTYTHRCQTLVEEVQRRIL